MHGPVRGHDPIRVHHLSDHLGSSLPCAQRKNFLHSVRVVEPRLLIDRRPIVLSVSVVCDMAAGVKQSREPIIVHERIGRSRSLGLRLPALDQAVRD